MNTPPFTPSSLFPVWESAHGGSRVRELALPSGGKPHRRHPLQRQGFSLVELIVVIAVIGILTALIVPAINGFGRSTALVSGGNTVASLVSVARQTAMSKNTLTALLLLTAQTTEDIEAGSADDDYRAATVLEYVRSTTDPSDTGAWIPITKWETLPTGIVVDASSSDDTGNLASSFLTNSPQPFPFKLQLPHKGRMLTNASGDFAARIFLPNGSLQNAAAPAQLRLVEGFREGGNTRYTRLGNSGRPANYYDIAIIGATGTPKISRP